MASEEKNSTELIRPAGDAAGHGYPPECIRRAISLIGVVKAEGKLRILLMLGDGRRNVGEMAEGIGATPSAVSHNLGLLRQSGLVEATRERQRMYYDLTARGRDVVRCLTILAELEL